MVKSLREWRAEKLLTIRDLASNAGVSNQTVVQIEHNRMKPQPRTIRRVCAALGVDAVEVTEFAAAIRTVSDGPAVDVETNGEAATSEGNHAARLKPLLGQMGGSASSEPSNEAVVGYIIAPNGLIRYASPSVERVLGHKNDVFTGANFFDLIMNEVHNDDQYQTMRMIHYLLANAGEVEELVVRIRVVNNDFREMTLTGSNLIDHPVIEGILLSGQVA